jgi:shikimate dehydrogenase
MGGGLGVEVQAAPFSSAATLIRHADLVVSAVPARAADPVAAELAGDWPRAATLFDLVYAPWPTAIAAAAGAAGAKVVGGLPMLVAQAGAQVRLMTGRVPPMAPMRAAGESALAGS